MIFFKGTRSIEPPAERRQLRRVPRVLASSFRLVWEAAPRRFMVSLAPQAVSAVIVGAQLVITRDLIAAVLATGSGGGGGRGGQLLVAPIGALLLGSGADPGQKQQQALLAGIVGRATEPGLLH